MNAETFCFLQEPTPHSVSQLIGKPGSCFSRVAVIYLKPRPQLPWARCCRPHTDTVPWDAPFRGPACSCPFPKSFLIAHPSRTGPLVTRKAMEDGGPQGAELFSSGPGYVVWSLRH